MDGYQEMIDCFHDVENGVINALIALQIDIWKNITSSVNINAQELRLESRYCINAIWYVVHFQILPWKYLKFTIVFYNYIGI